MSAKTASHSAVLHCVEKPITKSQLRRSHYNPSETCIGSTYIHTLVDP